MKAALLEAPKELVIGQIAQPRLAPGEVLMKPLLAGICGTDISFFQGHRQVQYPFVLGHEFMGRVVEVGKEVSRIRVGQRVIVEPNYPCGSCRLCLAGRGAVCAQKKSMGVNVPGCFSEFASAPEEFVWPLPGSISDSDAATIEPLAVSMHGLLQSGARPGDTVAVLGCGVVGLLLSHAATAAGVRVFAHDRIAEKLEMARGLGAVVVPEADPAQLWEKENVSTVFECAGVPATVELALQAAPRGAQVVLLGLSSSPAAFVPVRLVRDGINVRTSMIYDHPRDFAHVIERVAENDLHPARIVTHTFPIDRIREAVELAGTGAAGKVHLEFT
jgi:2-desacetyl-2-hydroxyethyl bacteriochlorophyllide A dehydrogenase